MTAYYNEIDPIAAEWLRRLIAAGHIAPGEVDERDIRDVTPAELVRFTQCHFFAGIGIWSLALRRAGWPDDRPVWSGSCPCQPFSAAGAGEGFADERHLWPHWHWLIQHCRPAVVVGEQVASKDGLWWHDLVSDDLGGIGYASGAVVVSAAGFGVGWRGSAESQRLERALRLCPDPLVARHLAAFADWADQSLAIGGFHIRERQYFVGLADDESGGRGVGGDASRSRQSGHADGGGDPPSRGVVDGAGEGSLSGSYGRVRGGEESSGPRDAKPERLGDASGLDDSLGDGRRTRRDRDHGRDERLESGPDGQDGRVVDDERAGLEGRGQGSTDAGLRQRSGAGPGGPAPAAGSPNRVGEPGGERRDGSGDEGREGGPGGGRPDAARHPAPAERVGDADGERQGQERGVSGRAQPEPDRGGEPRRVADGDGERRGQLGSPLDDDGELEPGNDDDGRSEACGVAAGAGRESADGAGEADGVRGVADWLLCRDGLWRPARPGSFPLAHAAPARVGRLRAYGNGLDLETATAFCAVVDEIVTEVTR